MPAAAFLNTSHITSMKKNTFFLFLFSMILVAPMMAQEEDEKLKISGSVDTYYKYDFSGNANIGTSFADEQNSISIGMLDLVFEKAVGKASFVGEIAFGPRNAGSAGPAPSGTTVLTGIGSDTSGVVPFFGSVSDYAPRIQNLYVSYALTDKLSITGGYMGTFVGYEIISPTGNFNYSTSYLFTNGPFQNAGVKLEYAFSDQFAVMAGVFNPWNVYTADPEVGPSSFGAQVYVSPVEGWDAYINFVTGGESGTEIDLTTTFQVSDPLMLGLNAAYYTDGGEDAVEATFSGAAAYVNYSLSDVSALGLRYEYFSASEATGILGIPDGTVSAITLSGNFKGGEALTLIPELRFDTSNGDIFTDGDGMATGSATQFVVGAVFAF